MARPNKLAGQRFADHWTAVEPVGSKGNEGVIWLFVSDCGESRKRIAGYARHLGSKCRRCGGFTSNLDLKGMRFSSHWTGVKRRRDKRTKKWIWAFVSDCGITKELFTGHRDTLPHYCSLCKDGWVQATATQDRRRSFGRRRTDKGATRSVHIDLKSEDKDLSDKDMIKELKRREKVLLRELEKAQRKLEILKKNYPTSRRKRKDPEFVPGDVVGHWMVLKEEQSSHINRHWCRCRCGNERYVYIGTLKKRSSDAKCRSCWSKAQMSEYRKSQVSDEDNFE